jgi:hypothetical protein
MTRLLAQPDGGMHRHVVIEPRSGQVIPSFVIIAA